MPLVGGSFRRALAGELDSFARAWPVCEIVAESWDPEDGDDVSFLEQLSSTTQIRLHCLSLNPLGDAPAEMGLRRVRGWIHRLRVDHVSDHYAWVGAGDVALGVFIPPIESVASQLDRVRKLRDLLGVALVLENIALPSAYESVRYHEALVESCARAEIGVLLDLENLRLDAHNAGVETSSLLDLYAGAPISGYHVAGSDVVPVPMDTHRHEVFPETLSLTREALRRHPAPVVYERDFALDAGAIAREVSRLQLELGNR